jgi:predicted nucleic acid-binding protein
MNVVDSCGWLEFMGEGANAAFFAPPLLKEDELIIPAVVIFEVCKRLNVLDQWAAADAFLSVAGRCRIAHLSPQELSLAAKAGIAHKLALADAIIWQTAQTHQAKLYTQDIDLKGLPGVLFKAKPASLSVAPTSNKVSK